MNQISKKMHIFQRRSNIKCGNELEFIFLDYGYQLRICCPLLEKSRGY